MQTWGVKAGMEIMALAEGYLCVTKTYVGDAVMAETRAFTREEDMMAFVARWLAEAEATKGRAIDTSLLS